MFADYLMMIVSGLCFMLKIAQLKSIYTNEQILIILLARLYFSKCQSTDVDEYIEKQTINWELFYEIVNLHNIRPFIYHTISKNHIKTCPEVKEKLKTTFTFAQKRNLIQANITQQLVKELQKNEISAIPYKGAIFGLSNYKDIALRESTDVDLLIDKADIEKVQAFFKLKGHIQKFKIPKDYLSYYKRFFRELIFRDESNAINIEVHWRLMDKFSSNYPEHQFFKNGLEVYQAQGISIIKLNPTYDFLILASNHFVKDMCIKFKYLLDVGCMIENHSNKLNKDLIESTALKYGFNKKLNTGLSIVNSLLGINYDDKALNSVDAELLKIPLAYPIHLPRMYISEPRYFFYNLKMQDSRFFTAKYVIRCIQYLFLPTYEDINRFKIPAFLLPLYIISRPFRLLYLAFKSQQKNTESLDS